MRLNYGTGSNRMMVRWKYGVSLRDRKLNIHWEVKSEAEMVRCGRSSWFGHLERTSADD